jgi:hypothetical protein
MMVAGGFPPSSDATCGADDTRGVNELGNFAVGMALTTDGAYRLDNGYVAFNYNNDAVWDQAWYADGDQWFTSTDGQNWTRSSNPEAEIFNWEMSHRS